MSVNKEDILKGITKIEDKVLASRLLDKAEQCRYSSFVFSDFLTPYEAALAKRVLNKLETLHFEFWGGYDDAERVVAVISQDIIFKEDIQHNINLGFIEIELLAEKALSHRDYLGSLLGLGIRREKIGDILVDEGKCTVIVHDQIADFIVYNIEKIGNVKASCHRISSFQFIPPKKQEKLISSTVASLRADAIASSGFGISRTKILDYFKSQRVSINWETIQNPAKLLIEGDVVSIRGLGRMVLEKVGGTTKKDRISILIKRFI